MSYYQTFFYMTRTFIEIMFQWSNSGAANLHVKYVSFTIINNIRVQRTHFQTTCVFRRRMCQKRSMAGKKSYKGEEVEKATLCCLYSPQGKGEEECSKWMMHHIECIYIN